MDTELQRGDAPALSVAVARGGSIIYERAVGWAVLPADHSWPVSGRVGQLDRRPARARRSMAFPIGSNTKAFTAVCLLLLQQDGKLQLDDTIERWLPNVTAASAITIRQLLTHTSGLPDDAPEPYLTLAVSLPTTASAIADRFGRMRLDFVPGTRYEYSNTNYVLASLIIERASGMSFHDFLWSRVVQPLGLSGVLDLDTRSGRAGLRVSGHERYALGSLRPDQLEAPGWYAGAGELAMPAATLALWDQSLMSERLLSKASWVSMQRPGLLSSGEGTGYGLALHTGTLASGKAVLFHGGVVEGFVSANLLVPVDQLSIVVLTNTAEDAAPRLRNALRDILEPPKQATDTAPAADALGSPAPNNSGVDSMLVSRMLADLRAGRLNRQRLTPNLNFYFNRQVRAEFRRSLKPLGPVAEVRLVEEQHENGMTFRIFHAFCARGALRISTYSEPNGLLEQFLVSRLPER